MDDGVGRQGNGQAPTAPVSALAIVRVGMANGGGRGVAPVVAPVGSSPSAHAQPPPVTPAGSRSAGAQPVPVPAVRAPSGDEQLLLPVLHPPAVQFPSARRASSSTAQVWVAVTGASVASAGGGLAAAVGDAASPLVVAAPPSVVAAAAVDPLDPVNVFAAADPLLIRAAHPQ